MGPSQSQQTFYEVFSQRFERLEPSFLPDFSLKAEKTRVKSPNENVKKQTQKIYCSKVAITKLDL